MSPRMNRRKFLKGASAAAAVGAVIPVVILPTVNRPPLQLVDETNFVSPKQGMAIIDKMVAERHDDLPLVTLNGDRCMDLTIHNNLIDVTCIGDEWVNMAPIGVQTVEVEMIVLPDDPPLELLTNTPIALRVVFQDGKIFDVEGHIVRSKSEYKPDNMARQYITIAPSGAPMWS